MNSGSVPADATAGRSDSMALSFRKGARRPEARTNVWMPEAW
jgi:hypothetical protein